MKFTEGNGLGAQFLRLENAGAADPLPLVLSTSFDFPSGFRDIEIGDINNDSSVDILDVVLLVNIVLGVGQANGADINQDDLINILDVVQLINIILA